MIIKDQLVQSLLFEEESTTLDFKRDQYKFVGANDGDKSELLKDVLAFANAWRRTDAYILIGVDELKGKEKSIVVIEEFLDDAQLQQFINSKTQKPLAFSYQNIAFRGTSIATIHIPVQERPFYITKDYGKLKKNVVYIRRGSSTDEATPEEIATMRLSHPEPINTLPKLRVAFVLQSREETSHLLVPSRKRLNRAEVIAILNKLLLRPEDVELVQKYSAELSSIKDRYPSGEEFPAFQVDHVNRFQYDILNTIRLATDNYDEFLNRCELSSRSYELFIDNLSEMLKRNHIFINLRNSGTSPAEGIIAYINGSNKLRFLKRETLNQETITLFDKVPDFIIKVIAQADKIKHGIIEPITTMFERAHNRKFNTLYDYVSPGFSMPIPRSFAPDPYQCSIRENRLQILIRDDLMHNHDFEIHAEPICLCPLLDLGEMVEIGYEVHAKNLPRPTTGKLVIEGV